MSVTGAVEPMYCRLAFERALYLHGVLIRSNKKSLHISFHRRVGISQPARHTFHYKLSTYSIQARASGQHPSEFSHPTIQPFLLLQKTTLPAAYNDTCAYRTVAKVHKIEEERAIRLTQNGKINI